MSQELTYDADQAPDARTWAETDEGVRRLAVEEHHRHLTAPHPKTPQPRLHAAIHVVVENQVATDKPPEAARAVARLMAGGLSRHEAVHAVGMLVSNAMAAAMEGRTHDPVVYARELDELTVERWRSLAEEG